VNIAAKENSMNRKVALMLLGASLLACNFLFPQTERLGPSATDFQDPVGAGFTIVRLHPQDGELKSRLADEVQKATALGQIPVVEFDLVPAMPGN
jgi:hypothetical protein